MGKSVRRAVANSFSSTVVLTLTLAMPSLCHVCATRQNWASFEGTSVRSFFECGGWFEHRAPTRAVRARRCLLEAHPKQQRPRQDDRGQSTRGSTGLDPYGEASGEDLLGEFVE